MSSFENLRVVDNFYQTSLFFPMPTVVISTLCEDGSTTLLPSKRIYTQNTHGTGCTLSSAIAAALAKREDLSTAAKSAKSYLEQAIISGADYEIGHGHGPVTHNFRFI